jgi:hypothetical protein
MKLGIFSVALFLTLGVLKSQDIPFEGEVLSDYGHEGEFFISVKVTDGPLKGRTETFYFKTSIMDENKPKNNTQLGVALGLPTIMMGSTEPLIVKGLVFRAIEEFSNPEFAGQVIKKSIYKVKEIIQLNPPLEPMFETVTKEAKFIGGTCNPDACECISCNYVFETVEGEKIDINLVRKTEEGWPELMIKQNNKFIPNPDFVNMVFSFDYSQEPCSCLSDNDMYEDVMIKIANHINVPAASSFDNAVYLAIEKIHNQWAGSYLNAQGITLVITSTEIGREQYQVDFKLKSKDGSTCKSIEGLLDCDEKIAIGSQDQPAVKLEITQEGVIFNLPPNSDKKCVMSFDKKFIRNK